MIATAAETMATFEHTDAAFAPHAPALTATEPALPLIRASRGCFSSGSRQYYPSDTACERRLFVLGGGKAAIGGGNIRGAAKDRDVAIERRRPQRHVGRSRSVNVVRRDDL